MPKKIKEKNKIGVFTSIDLFNIKKERFNGYAIGHGTHGDVKYNRKRKNKELDKFDNLK